jgi:hypothetical protein
MSDSRYRRRAPFRPAREDVLVVCGGQTEQIYFDAFKRAFHLSLGNINIVIAVEAKNPLQIVEYAIKARHRKEDYNAVWCVFDKDDFTDFDDAVEYAKRSGIMAAFSNQAFEVWFINHYRLLDSALSRSRFKDELSRLLSFPYDKGKQTVSKVCQTIVNEDRLKMAMVNARLGYERHRANTIPAKPSAFESCTTVYQLAKSLLKWAE